MGDSRYTANRHRSYRRWSRCALGLTVIAEASEIVVYRGDIQHISTTYTGLKTSTMADDAGIGPGDVELSTLTESQRARSEAAGKFGITARELSAPEAGMDEDTVFMWQSKEPIDLSRWGGIDGIVQKLQVDPKQGPVY